MNSTSRFRQPRIAHLAITLVIGGAAFTSAMPARAADTAPSLSTTAKKPAPSRWTEAVSKHGGSGVKLRYSVADALQPGVTADVRVQFSGVTADDASVELRAPQGATLTDAAGNAVSNVKLPRGTTTTLALRLTPSADGLQTLDVFTSQDQRFSAQSVPLKVGSGKMKLEAMGKVQTTPSGEKVISLPAETR